MRDGYMKALLVIKVQVLLSSPPISEEKKRDDAISFPSFCSEVLKGRRAFSSSLSNRTIKVGSLGQNSENQEEKTRETWENDKRK